MDKNKPLSGIALKIVQSIRQFISAPAENRLGPFLELLFFLGIALLVIPTEPLKLLMRRNIGEDVFEKTSLKICCVLYMGWAAFLYHLYKVDADAVKESSIYLAGVAFYGILVLWLLYTWIFEHEQEQDKKDSHRGDSVFFASLVQYGFSDNVICAFVEPISCMVVSAGITMLNLYIGLPMLITSISFFANEIHEVYFIPQAEAENDKKIKKAYANKIRDEVSDEKYDRVN